MYIIYVYIFIFLWKRVPSTKRTSKQKLRTLSYEIEHPHLDLVLIFLGFSVPFSTSGLAASSTFMGDGDSFSVDVTTTTLLALSLDFGAVLSDLAGLWLVVSGGDGASVAWILDPDVLVLRISATVCSSLTFNWCTNSSASLAKSPSGRNGLSLSLKNIKNYVDKRFIK